MKLSGLHLLLTYQCNFECAHCFVWGSPRQAGTMTLEDVRRSLHQAREAGTVESIYFEGGEPFLFYPVMLRGVQEAAAAGFHVGLVTNGYWATSADDALEWLRPLVGLVDTVSLSSDLYHSDEKLSRQTRIATEAARQLGISLGVISIASPDVADAATATGQLPQGESAVMYRGRAVEKLAAQASPRHWEQFTTCPYENLREPGRLHVDPLGYLHICHGITMGNLLHTSLKVICEEYDADSHPITGPLLAGGPAELVRRHGLHIGESFADACHLCYEARRALREEFPDILAPDQMYGVQQTR